jgi:uncharacterized protein YaiE (UPF0345 family)
MKKFFSTVKGKVLGAIGFASASVTQASAAVDVSGVALDTSAVETLAVVILGALAIIWVARKVVSFLA